MTNLPIKRQICSLGVELFISDLQLARVEKFALVCKEMAQVTSDHFSLGLSTAIC